MSTDSFNYTILEVSPSFVYGRIDLSDISELSQGIEEAINEDDYQKGEIGNITEDDDEQAVDPETRQATINWLEGDHDFKDIVNMLVEDINSDYFNIDFDYAPDWQYTCYFDTTDHYDWHQDHYEDDGEDEFKRTLSISICLSSDDCYEGAEFFIKDQSETNVRVFKMRYGDFIVFPSNIEHRVNALREGERISLVVWYGVDLD